MTTLLSVDVGEDLPDAVRRVLSHDEFTTLIRETVLADATPDVRDRVLAMAEKARLDILSQADHIPVQDELHWTLALSYMELKAQWLSRQVRICYEEMITGSCDRAVAAEASVVSTILQLIEPLLDRTHLQEIESLFVSQTAD